VILTILRSTASTSADANAYTVAAQARQDNSHEAELDQLGSDGEDGSCGENDAS